MKRLQIILSILILFLFSLPAFAQNGITELTVGDSKSLTTSSLTGLPTAFGGSDGNYAVFRISGLKPGQRYEATLTYDAGTDIGYGHSWVDGNPFTSEWFSFIGIGSGTGTGKQHGKQDKFLFSIDRESTKDILYVVLRSNRPWPISFSVKSPSGVNRDSRDKWGYYFVTDFDADKNAPFLLKR